MFSSTINKVPSAPFTSFVSSNEDDDKDLIAFLRQSHKNRTNIYNFMDQKNDQCNDHLIRKVDTNEVTKDNTNENQNTQDSTLEVNKKITKTMQDNPRIPKEDTDPKEDAKMTNQAATHSSRPARASSESNGFESLKQPFKELDTSNPHQMRTNIYQNYRPRLRDTLEILPKRKHTEDRWEEAKKISAESSPDPESLDSRDPMPQLEVVETEISTNRSETLKDVEVYESDTGLSSDDPDLLHYSQRSRSVSRSPRARRSNQAPVNIIKERPPRPARLSRRKSLSEDNLLAPNQRKESTGQTGVDAFGLPRISVQSRRSVSLMRDSFMSKKAERSSPASQLEGRQRSISKETQTSNASEFKAKFEIGSVSNLSKVSRSNAPYKPPKVDKTHLSKVKTKFNDISTDNLKLPFPNFRPIPPRPKGKPPPPPPL